MKRALAVAALACFSFLLAGQVGAERAGYDGLVNTVTPQTVRIESGEAQEVRVQVKNTGSTTWQREGGAYISVYTVNPNYHPSPYRGPSWWSDHQFGQLVESELAPGEVGTVVFTVYGPPSFEGTLVETFRLAAENTSWIGSPFQITMQVGETVEEVTTAPSTPTETVDSSAGYDGELVIASVNEVSARARQMVPLKLAFRNSGTKTWGSINVETPQNRIATGSSSDFYNSTWVSSHIAYQNTSASVLPGATMVVDVFFQAPSSNGEHTATFQLVADGVTLEDAVVNIPVTVTGGSAERINDPVNEERVDQIVTDGELIEEPRVRVGIDQVTGEEVIFSANTEVTVVESDMGYERYVIPAGQAMRVSYNSAGKYAFSSGDVLHVADSYLRFEGVDHDTIFTVSSHTDIRSWNTSLNDNTFRDTLEIRYNSKKDRVWLINELPMEYYVYGVDETSNTAPEEYHKALSVAVRTYAQYAWETKSKYAGEFIELRSTTYDQVYRGYGAEIRRDNWIDRVQATEGTTIQYDGSTIIAAYFSRSDGRTRDWADVWGREVPYALGVEVPCERGQTMWGHGVGMSALGAVCLAEEEGYTYDEILHHFYTDVDLVRRW